ncbi:MAG: MarR family winged helix-turn-helix transcriptional regulator [Stellaceae bacterium]
MEAWGKLWHILRTVPLKRLDRAMPSQRPRTIFLLRLLQLNIYNLLVERLAEFELTPIQYMVLSISGGRDSWSTADLARRFHIAPQSMNEVVATLRKQKLIERHKSPLHRRILYIRLTASGTRVLEKCDKAVDGIERDAFREFAREDIAVFRELMTKALAKFVAREKPARKPVSSSIKDNGRNATAQRRAM